MAAVLLRRYLLDENFDCGQETAGTRSVEEHASSGSGERDAKSCVDKTLRYDFRSSYWNEFQLAELFPFVSSVRAVTRTHISKLH